MADEENKEEERSDRVKRDVAPRGTLRPPKWIQGKWTGEDGTEYTFTTDDVIHRTFGSLTEYYRGDIFAGKARVTEQISSTTVYQFYAPISDSSGVRTYRFERVTAFSLDFTSLAFLSSSTVRLRQIPTRELFGDSLAYIEARLAEVQRLRDEAEEARDIANAAKVNYARVSSVYEAAIGADLVIYLNEEVIRDILKKLKVRVYGNPDLEAPNWSTERAIDFNEPIDVYNLLIDIRNESLTLQQADHDVHVRYMREAVDKLNETIDKDNRVIFTPSSFARMYEAVRSTLIAIKNLSDSGIEREKKARSSEERITHFSFYNLLQLSKSQQEDRERNAEEAESRLFIAEQRLISFRDLRVKTEDELRELQDLFAEDGT